MADEAEAKLQRKAAKKALKAAAVAEEAGDEAEAKAQRKIAKKATKAAEAAAEPVEEPEVDEEEAKRLRKAAKKAAKAAAAAAEEGEDEAPKAKKAKVAEDAGADAAPVVSLRCEDNFKVFIKGLPYSVEETKLRADFAECGKINKLQLPMEDVGRPKGFAFITFDTQEAFEAALKYDNTDYGGRYINVSKADGSSTKGQNTGKDGQKGKDKGKGKGKEGDWTCPKCGDNVFARNNACRQCGTERPGGPIDTKGHDHERTVFIRGIAWAVTEEVLQKDFGECGEIENFRMPMNGEGRPAGLAFIKYVTQEGVDGALKFNETDYGGRMINVMMSGEGQGKGKGKDGKGKDKGKDGGKGKDGKGKKGKDGKSKAPSASFANKTGCIVASTAEVKTFADSDDE